LELSLHHLGDTVSWCGGRSVADLPFGAGRHRCIGEQFAQVSRLLSRPVLSAQGVEVDQLGLTGSTRYNHCYSRSWIDMDSGSAFPRKRLHRALSFSLISIDFTLTLTPCDTRLWSSCPRVRETSRSSVGKPRHKKPIPFPPPLFFFPLLSFRHATTSA
jgi:hypothetical protein